MKTFLKAIHRDLGIERLSSQDGHKVLEGAQASIKFDYSQISESEKMIVQDDITMKILIMGPKGIKGTFRAFMFIHGGGWILGDYPTHKLMVRDLVLRSRAAGVVVKYTRTPEAAYPTAINEVYAATKWVSEY